MILMVIPVALGMALMMSRKGGFEVRIWTNG